MNWPIDKIAQIPCVDQSPNLHKISTISYFYSRTRRTYSYVQQITSTTKKKIVNYFLFLQLKTKGNKFVKKKLINPSIAHSIYNTIVYIDRIVHRIHIILKTLFVQIESKCDALKSTHCTLYTNNSQINNELKFYAHITFELPS